MIDDRVQVTLETTYGPKVFLVDPDALEEAKQDFRLDDLYKVMLRVEDTPGHDAPCGENPWSLLVYDMFVEVRKLLANDGRKLF